jgi:NAD(P)-dependent dehydrogenase (short-subunit alcohol dehydrogenase family)
MLQEQDLEETLDKSFYSLLLLIQAIESAGITAGQINLITSDMQDITGDEQLSPAKATILGLYHTIPLEYPTFQCHCIDITLPESENLQKANLLKQLLQELLSKPAGALIALRGNHRWKQVFDPIQPESKEVVPLRQNGVYLITGGLGGIGLAMAEYLARSVKARLVLVGRTPLPPRNDWDNWLGSMGAEEGIGYQLHKVLFLEALGAEVQTFAADVANQKQMQSVIQQTIDTFGHLDGVIHAAGIPGAGLIRTKTAEQASRVLAPKINGTIVLDRVLQNVPLDFLALFSSITASIGGGPGQVDYCAANAFLGAFAHMHHSSSEQRRVIALDWGEWQWNAWEGSLAGEALREVRDSFRENRQRFGITFEEGAEAFKQALALNVPRVVIATQNIEELLALSKAFTITNILQRVTQKDPLKATYPRPMLGTPYVTPRNELERTIATLWGNMLGISEVGVDDNFFELGGNSLLGIDLIMRLGKEMHMPALPAHVLYEAPTISAIARYMEQGAQVAFIEERDTRGRKRRETLENRRNSVRGKR